MKSNALLDVVFSFDTTGSMYNVLDEVRRNVKSLVGKLFADLPNLRVGAITHGCYHDGPANVLPLTRWSGDVESFVASAPRTRGGGAHACYELALAAAARLEWRPEAQGRVLVVIGDEPPHERGTTCESDALGVLGRQWTGRYPKLVTTDWVAELDRLARLGVVVHGVQALAKHYAAPFYDALARRTDGSFVTLDQFAEVEHLVLGSCYRAAGEAELLSYAQEVERKGQLTRSVDRVFQALGGAGYTSRVQALPKGLVPVAPGRFQKLRVPEAKRGQDAKDARVKISDFVRGRGLGFNLGRGFYELTKSVKVQAHKECVLENRSTGDLFTGVAARRILGLPDGADVTLNPRKLGDVGYRAYIQSTAENRLLQPGTALLYEVTT